MTNPCTVLYMGTSVLHYAHKHTYTAGGEAEAAGVKVGDKVLEVNGEDCEKLRDPTKIVALKLMIQQTDIREVC